jgi:hypothetical protein
VEKDTGADLSAFQGWSADRTVLPLQGIISALT